MRLARAVGTDSPKDWSALPGSGQYVARAAAVSSAGARVAMLDTNFERVIKRVFAGTWMADYRRDMRLAALALETVRGGVDPRAVNWAVLDLGSQVCRPRRPKCGQCPLQRGCKYRIVADSS